MAIHPPLISSILLLASCVLAIISAILSLHIPWVRANVTISQLYYKIKLPIDIGLLECFSDICKDVHYIELLKSTDQPIELNSNSISKLSSGMDNALNDEEVLRSSSLAIIDGHKKYLFETMDHDMLRYERVLNANKPSTEGIWTSLVSIPSQTVESEAIKSQFRISEGDISIPIHIPKKVATPTQDEINNIIRRTIRDFERPFKKASYVTLPLFAVMTVTAVICLLLNVYCLIKFQTIVYTHQLSLVLVVLLFQTLAVLSYIALSISHINGGEYLRGVWITTYSAIISIILTMLASTISDKSISYNHQSVPYSSIVMNPSPYYQQAYPQGELTNQTMITPSAPLMP